MPRPLEAECAVLIADHKALMRQQKWLEAHPRARHEHRAHIAHLQAHTKRLHALTARYRQQRERVHASRKRPDRITEPNLT